MMTKLQKMQAEVAYELDRLRDLSEKLEEGLYKLVEVVEAFCWEEEGSDPAPATDPAPKTEKPITLEQVRAALTALSSAKGAAAAKALLNEFGAVKLSEVPAKRYASLLIEAEAWTNE